MLPRQRLRGGSGTARRAQLLNVAAYRSDRNRPRRGYSRFLWRLEGEIEALLSRARETDAAEDARFGEAFRGDELPEELRRREDRLAAIRAAKARLKARQREADQARGREPGSKRNRKGGRPYKREYGEPDEKAQDNFTDPESRIMKTSSEGFQQSYNAQVAVEGENQLIVATEVSSSASDQGRLVPLVDEVEATHWGTAGDGAGGCGLLQRGRP